MSDFKVGDKVGYVPNKCLDICTVLAVGENSVFVRFFDGEESSWLKTLTVKAAPPLPTPPEGREVDQEMRVPAMGDMYFEPTVNPPRFLLSHAQRIEPRYCLRPLPPKPEGEGWEWRKPTNGDEYQALDRDGERRFDKQIIPFDDMEYLSYVRIGFRWCRKKPKSKVKRWESVVNGVDSIVTIPFIDTGTGPRLDTDKIGREWAIKWLENQVALDVMAKRTITDMLRKEQEAQ